MSPHPLQANNSIALTENGFTYSVLLAGVVPDPCHDIIIDTPWLQPLKTEPLSNDVELGMVGVGSNFVFMSMCE